MHQNIQLVAKLKAFKQKIKPITYKKNPNKNKENGGFVDFKPSYTDFGPSFADLFISNSTYHTKPTNKKSINTIRNLEISMNFNLELV